MTKLTSQTSTCPTGLHLMERPNSKFQIPSSQEVNGGLGLASNMACCRFKMPGNLFLPTNLHNYLRCPFQLLQSPIHFKSLRDANYISQFGLVISHAYSDNLEMTHPSYWHLLQLSHANNLVCRRISFVQQLTPSFCIRQLIFHTKM